MNDIVLEVKNLSHSFGKKNVLHNVNLKIERGSFVALVGQSGAGKSTLFRSILGTHPPKKGSVLINKKSVIKPNRHVGIVYQHYSLYEFLTSEKNIAFGLKLDQTKIFDRFFRPIWYYRENKKFQEQAKELLCKLGLEKAIGCYPKDLSGGMKQRVAIGQALIMKPEIILLDEPFGALDEGTREDLQKMILYLYQENLKAKKNNQPPPYTVVLVTHELNEAFYLSDRIIGLSQFWEKDNQLGLECGATICYDKPCVIYHPDEVRDYNRFLEQKVDLINTIFSEKVNV